ncbi:PEP-CTERM sorting domain-containing protein [Kamptonema cortianum]|nr:PEP-CTERM sorting domain-containing protein [Oscillatoria laete-virens]MDK3157153.1 PEP-CTERM sorting domain-containing protein [Kamptonema cortianum]MDL5051130.1 PEP-CTERM sorting domain-containing protein [Oscillatoria amoena NRMC-F 0135]MDL5055036.1 PEP-CTERM sorting domain-containing protein [Oscillatoria laete-virens NRMC-F 0139]
MKLISFITIAILTFCHLLSAQTVYNDFETGMGSWTTTGTAWTTNIYAGQNQYIPAATGQHLSHWIDSWPDDGANNDGLTGTIYSTAFSVTATENLLTFRNSGFSGTGGSTYSTAGPTGDGVNTAVSQGNNKWEIRLGATNGTLIAQGGAPMTDGPFIQYQVDLSSYVNTNVYFVGIDNATTGHGWLGFDYFVMDYTDSIVAVSTEIDGQAGWTLTGATWAWQTKINNTSQVVKDGGEFIRSFDNGTGTARSADFMITGTNLQFYTAGYGAMDPNGSPNRIHLRNALDDSILYTWGDDEALGGDNFMLQAIDVTTHLNLMVYFELVDNVNGGFGWVGLDGARLYGVTPIPEPSSMALSGLALIIFAGVLLKRKLRTFRART